MLRYAVRRKLGVMDTIIAIRETKEEAILQATAMNEIANDYNCLDYYYVTTIWVE